ncbi:MAG: hypothetical protein ACK506_00255, partial [Pirellula sp.]
MLALYQLKARLKVRERYRLLGEFSELAIRNRIGFDSRCSNTVEQLPQLFGKPACYLKSKTAMKLVPANSWSRTRKG